MHIMETRAINGKLRCLNSGPLQYKLNNSTSQMTVGMHAVYDGVESTLAILDQPLYTEPKKIEQSDTEDSKD